MKDILNPSDPRVIRTRNLIVDAFAYLLKIKDFNSITINDITNKATINRTTFYAHFPDKYALIDGYLSNSFIEFVYRRVESNATLNEETIKNIVISLCEFHEASNKRCMKSYDSISPHLEKNTKIQLENFLSQLLTKSCTESARRSLDLAITMLTWSIYGVTYRWNMDGRIESPQVLAEKILPMLKGYLEHKIN
ncbi:TetR/AcrR family transcriptional regulator [Paenibacillus illinoisensis]|uniref:TetR/AcrR family transcriptional regulator n=1 Tax=Paenibacillus illinoisensis TaxID=59845 RepID=A0ABW8HQW1_9BACL